MPSGGRGSGPKEQGFPKEASGSWSPRRGGNRWPAQPHLRGTLPSEKRRKRSACYHGATRTILTDTGPKEGNMDLPTAPRGTVSRGLSGKLESKLDARRGARVKLAGPST